MGFPADNRTYESWLRTQCQVVEEDLAYKHELMRQNAFVFLRATFFRWARRIEETCPDLADATKVLAIGDLHVENFGTWRDREGRLVWGVNDFDEGAVTPYVFDLVRLATSARLAPDRVLGNRKAAAAILEGYREELTNPRPVLLDEQETWMREHVVCSDEDRAKFWDEVDGYPDADPPAEVRAALRASMPKDAREVRFATRRKGGGSLGRPRFVAIAKWRGGRIVREAKALAPSAWDWAHSVDQPVSRAMDLSTSTYRSPDPHFAIVDRFVIRRVAADSRKIGLGDHAGEALHAKVLRVMGFDLGAIHAADRTAAHRIGTHLDALPTDWLRDHARNAATEVAADFRAWRVQTRRWRDDRGSARLVAPTPRGR